jgi:hypothetical protein
MVTLFKKAVVAGTLAATALTAAAPAEAQRYYRRDRGGDVATGAIIGGIVGLGVGAAIASDRGRYRGPRGYYGRPYYRGGYYAPRGYYYAPPRRFYRPRAYYGPRYAPVPYGYGYRGGYGRGYYGY